MLGRRHPANVAFQDPDETPPTPPLSLILNTLSAMQRREAGEGEGGVQVGLGGRGDWVPLEWRRIDRIG